MHFRRGAGGWRKAAVDAMRLRKTEGRRWLTGMFRGNDRFAVDFRSVFLCGFSICRRRENMSVLPTNAAVFYVIFIDKDVDNF